MAVDEAEQNTTVEETKNEILKAMKRGLNVTANAAHIRDLADAYNLLSDAQGTGRRKVPASPLVQK